MSPWDKGVRTIDSCPHRPGVPAQRDDRGAALIVALGVLTLLLVIALTFFRASRQEVQTASNTVNSVRAEILADGATSVAIAFLNHDLNAHPSLTSLDHAWRTYFNGSWAVGKPGFWALPNPVTPAIGVPPFRNPAVNGGAPGIYEIDPATTPMAPRLLQSDDLYIPRLVGDLTTPVANYTQRDTGDIDGDGNTTEPLLPFATSTDLGDWPMGDAFAAVGLFGPGTAQLGDTVFPDFQTGAFPMILGPPDNNPNDDSLPAEQVHFWTDVDNDGDGLRDSMWLPVGSDIVLDRDGIDNNLNGAIDEPGETAPFLYYGGIDGRDNDRDGQIDEDDEKRLYLTTPIVDAEGNVLVDPDAILAQAVDIDRLREFDTDFPDTGIPNNLVVDRLDNDLDLLVNGGQSYVVISQGQPGFDPDQPGFGVSRIADRYLVALAPGLEVHSTGENVTELTGRMAILIKDEASKVNVNAAGGYSYSVLKASADPNVPLTHAFNEGVGPHEYDMRVLPLDFRSNNTTRSVGPAFADKFWDYRMGAPRGLGLKSDPAGFAPAIPILDPTNPDPFAADVGLPGYGFVDDNGNIISELLDGIDNDGNGFIDDGLFAYDYDNDPNTPPTISPHFEGLDEPQEWQRFRPLRNLIAETDGNDDDQDDSVDEIGELGDRYFHTNDQLKGVDQIGDVAARTMRNSITVHSIDRNDRHNHKNADATLPYRTAYTRQATGPRQNLNVARANDVARAVRRNWRYIVSRPEFRTLQLGAADQTVGDALGFIGRNEFGSATTPFDDPVLALDFVRGLRQENVSIYTTENILGIANPLYSNTIDGANGDGQPDNAFALLADARLRAHQIAATAADFADRDATRTVDDAIYADDTWWQTLAGRGLDQFPNDPLINAAANLAQAQEIYYTVAGQESVRINEIMARPVRRFEAEAITQGIDLASLDLNDSFNRAVAGLDPNRFVRQNRNPIQIENDGFRIRVKTTQGAIDEINASRPTNPFEIVDPILPLSPASSPLWEGRIGKLDGSLLGLSSAWATYRQYVTLQFRNANNRIRRFEVPDVVQFSFQATDQLPPGRYYVTINTQSLDSGSDGAVLNDSVNSEGDFNFAVKIGNRRNDLFTDVVNIRALARGERVYTNAWRTPALLGAQNLGGSQGMAFLQGDAVFRSVAAAGSLYSNQSNFAINNRQEPNRGFTIEVPPRGPASASIDDQLWLHIALRSRRPDTQAFVVNFFEFSQEPDHEWVEVVNLDKQNPVDMSGWQLAVENHPLGLGPFTVPQNTIIAPGGMLLLGVNKFDYGFDIDPRDRGRGFYSNGIGLARGNEDVLPQFSAVSVPITFFGGAGAQGSVFLPFFDVDLGTYADFVDTDGDGIYDDAGDTQRPNLPDDIVTSTDGAAEQAVANLPRPVQAPGMRPFDRIVELEIPDLIPTPPFVNLTAGDVGRIVLGGGIFPNRPEYDGWDNDGDNVTLANDFIDNDGDGLLDRYGFDNDSSTANDNDPAEGIDEGRYRRVRRLAGDAIAVPGEYNPESIAYTTAFASLGPNSTDGFPGYLDKSLNPPEWMEFVERRNFPGDNVIVTLYEGSAKNNQIADRVTYTQRDVDNRAIDDIVQVTDMNLDPNGEGDTTYRINGNRNAAVPEPLNPAYLSLWHDNTMGVDFARSLERKDPLYTGDRFGTTNRFQATDGNYDDWADSTSRWERLETFDDNGNVIVEGIFDRLGAASNVYASFAHAISGTPLRRNVPASYVETATPPREDLFRLADFRNRNMVSPGDLITMPHTSKRQRLQTTSRVNAQGANEGFIAGRAPQNVALDAGVFGTLRRDTTYDEVLLGQRFDDISAPINYFRDLRAFAGDVGTTDAAEFNVGQASVYTLTSRPDDGWRHSAPVRIFATQIWSPIMLMPLEEESGGLGPNGGFLPGQDLASFSDPLFQGAFDVNRFLFESTPAVPPTLTTDRWPLERRAVIYASRNLDTFNQNVLHSDGAGAEALFVWDGDDGLENGEYDVFLVTAENLDPLLGSPFLLSDTSFTGITDFGQRFVATTELSAPKDLLIDVEAFTDRDGDRKVWTDFNGDGFPQNTPGSSELNRGQPGQPSESFGVQEALQPDASGVVHYGVVRVENNYLALLLRNWAKNGETNRFSRVILAPHNKTPGRININTVETRRIKNDQPDRNVPENFFNALQGIPGVLARAADDSDVRFEADATNGRTLAGFTTPRHPQELARQIVEQRQRLLPALERPDGRYYELTADLLSDAHFALAQDANGNPALRPPLVVDDQGFVQDQDANGLPDVTANRANATVEAAYRFKRMQNLITTRSDVFEILVTVQTGYGVDANGDGRVNWRDDNEFTVTAEKTTRTVYER